MSLETGTYIVERILIPDNSCPWFALQLLEYQKILFNLFCEVFLFPTFKVYFSKRRAVISGGTSKLTTV